MAGDQNDILQQFFPQWARITDTLLRQEIRKQGLVFSNALLSSLRSEVNIRSRTNGFYRLFFAEHGRFRDMGAGRGGRQQRTPKKWYSKVVYKRIYGSLVAQLVAGYREKLVRDIKGNLTAKQA